LMNLPLCQIFSVLGRLMALSASSKETFYGPMKEKV